MEVFYRINNMYINARYNMIGLDLHTLEGLDRLRLQLVSHWKDTSIAAIQPKTSLSNLYWFHFQSALLLFTTSQNFSK